MRWAPALLLLLSAAASAVPTAQAAQPAPAGGLDCAAALLPPCGYIQPIVNIDVEGKKKCKAVDRSDCYALPAKGESLEIKGKLQYYWKESEDGIYPQTDASDPVTITFAGTSSNPKWLAFKVEPDTFTIGPVELLDPNNHKTDANNVAYFWFERPITITVTHSGDPTQAELDRLALKEGVQQVLVKAKADTSGAYYREGFGVEDLKFEASSLLPAGGSPSGQGDGAKASPAGGLLAVVAPLAAVAFALRRRAL